jgi:hypothetical protein
LAWVCSSVARPWSTAGRSNELVECVCVVARSPSGGGGAPRRGAVAAGRGRGKGRAPGGCLGAKRRRRTWHAATSPGEPRAGFDPGISEWGNPPQRWGTAARIDRAAGRTRGTETSQYPEERTSTETPSVAASERGPGQRPRGANRNRLERRARAGDSPVRARASLRSSSRAGHVEPCPNVGGPPSKPKYSLATDSEPVP